MDTSTKPSIPMLQEQDATKYNVDPHSFRSLIIAIFSLRDLKQPTIYPCWKAVIALVPEGGVLAYFPPTGRPSRPGRCRDRTALSRSLEL